LNLGFLWICFRYILVFDLQLPRGSLCMVYHKEEDRSKILPLTCLYVARSFAALVSTTMEGINCHTYSRSA
jgi:hypothetical protein